MPTHLQAELHRVVVAAVKDALDLGVNPLDSIVLKQDVVRITTRRKRHTGRLFRKKEQEFWTKFYVKEGYICAQDGWTADSDVNKGEERQYETLHGLLYLNDIYRAAMELVANLSSKS